LHPAWIGLLGFVLYAPTIAYGYVDYDDPWLIRDNALLRELSLDSIWRVCTDFSWEQRHRLGVEYLPVRDLSVMLDHALYGDWVGGFHLTQVLLYAGCCALLATLTLALFGRRDLAWTTGALFAVHPVHVEAVAWLSERKGLLSAFLLTASLLCAVRWLRRGGWAPLASSSALFLLAVGAKGLAIAGVGALVLIVLWLESPMAARKKAALVCVYAAAGLLMFVPNFRLARTFGVVGADGGAGLSDRLLLFAQAHTQYLELMGFGGPYAIRYGIEPGVAGFGDWAPGAFGAIAAAAIVIWALRVPRLRTAATFGLGWWLLFLAPISHLFATIQNFVADRYLFLPSFGLLLTAATLLRRLPAAAAVALTAIIIFVGSAWTLAQMPTWSSTERLFENLVERVPGDASGWDKLAAKASEAGDTELAWGYTERGLEKSPDHWRLLHRQGLLLSGAGKLDAAIEVMTKAASTPEAHLAYANLALLHLRRGDRAKARGLAEEAVRLQAETAHNQRVLGIVTYELGDPLVACRAFRRAYALDPYDEDNLQNLELCGEKAEEQPK
jgi:Tfp pilus assembly protein PilF